MTDLGPYTEADFRTLIESLTLMRKELESVIKLHEHVNTHIHKEDLIERAAEIIEKVYRNPGIPPQYQQGLQFDMSNWLAWYRREHGPVL